MGWPLVRQSAGRALGAFFVGAATLFALAQPARPVSADVVIDGATVVINEVEVITIRSAQGGLSAPVRAQAAVAALSAANSTDTVRTESSPNGIRLMLGTRAVATVTQAEARAANSTPEGLAAQWTKNINDALRLPALAIDRTRVNMPPDRGETIRLTGSLARRAKVLVVPEGVVSLERSRGQLRLRPKGAGRARVQVINGDAATVVDVAVLPYAAQLPQSLTARVMGSPASAEAVTSAVTSAVRHRLAVPPDARITVEPVVGRPLPNGLRTQYSVRVTVSAADRVTTTGLVNVSVQNMGVFGRYEDELWYSNEPENIRWTGQLYWGRLRPRVPVRLLVHHFNRASEPIIIQYALVNPTDETVSVSMTMGDAEPDADPTRCGYRAGLQFFREWLAQSADVIEIPARSAVPIVLRRMGPGETVSGLASLRLMEGAPGDVTLVANAVWENDVPGAWRPALGRALPWRLARAEAQERLNVPLTGEERHVYPNPLREEEFTYAVGGRHAFVRIGEQAIPDGDGARRLAGNFGVHYNIKGRIVNPTDRRARVEIAYEASAGWSGAVFYVNGQIIEGNLLRTKTELRLLQLDLAPGASQLLNIQTIPLSGAHYPMTLIVREN